MVAHSDAMAIDERAPEPVGGCHDQHGRHREGEPPRDHSGPAVGGMNEAVDEGEAKHGHAADRMRPGWPHCPDLAAEQEIDRTGKSAESAEDKPREELARQIKKRFGLTAKLPAMKQGIEL